MICKKKLFAKDNINFSSENVTAKNIKNKLDLIVFTLQSNHSYVTFNITYASLTMLTIDTLLYRNYRVSKLWQDLFWFDMILREKRERSAFNVLLIQMLNNIKRS